MRENSLSSDLIEVVGLTKKVADVSGELTILDDIHFTVRTGGTLALVGASGSGKSTLLGLLAGLDLPSSGTVVINGVDVYALDEDGRAALRKSQLGFVFQSFQLLPHLTALENVMVPMDLRGGRPDPRPARELLSKVGLGERMDHYPVQLSGGEQQRVAIARAFVTRPRLLFADEPTGNLDGDTARRVADMIFELNRDAGTALVLVTHDLELASRCGQVVRLRNGQRVEP